MTPKSKDLELQPKWEAYYKSIPLLIVYSFWIGTVAHHGKWQATAKCQELNNR